MGGTPPLIIATPILDGGAFNRIEELVSPYYAALDRARTRGISFKGMVFENIYSFVDDTASVFGSTYGLFELSIYSALVRIETQVIAGVRTPTRLPNIISEDEEENGDILWRWLDHLPVIAPFRDSGDYSEFFMDTNSAGKLVIMPGWNSETGAFNVIPQPGGGSNTFRQHRVRNARFLDENHALYFVQNIVVPIPPDDTLFLGWDSYGVVKARGR